MLFPYDFREAFFLEGEVNSGGVYVSEIKGPINHHL